MPEFHTTLSTAIISLTIYFTPRDGKLLASKDHVVRIFLCSGLNLVPGPGDAFLMSDLKLDLGEEKVPRGS